MVMVAACSLFRQHPSLGLLLGYLKSLPYKLIPSFSMSTFLSLKGSIKVDGGEGECAVCLCGMGQGDHEVLSRLRCDHVFHKSCLDRWAEHRGQTCPLCRSHFEAEPSGCKGEKSTRIVFCPFGDSGLGDTDIWWIR